MEMKVKWIELEEYYTYRTAYPKTELNVGDGREVQNMEYTYITEEKIRHKKVEKVGTISYLSVEKIFTDFFPTPPVSESIYHLNLVTAVTIAIERKYETKVCKLLINNF